MSSALQLHGFHHLTAVTANPQVNLRFYTDVLGLRLVKKTVNQDDVSAYHLFYGDGAASPGSDITFFTWPAAPERRGTRAVVRTGFLTKDSESLAWWQDWLRQNDVSGIILHRQGDRSVLHFEDPEGQRLSLVAGSAGAPAFPWAGSAVPPAHQLRGLGLMTLSVPELEPTAEILTGVMNLSSKGSYRDAEGIEVHTYVMESGERTSELHLRVEPGTAPTRAGAGGVHHVAFRTPDFGQYEGWAHRLREFRIPNSGPVDRFYFRSLYFREPSGVLFEIATDGPGFATDEPLEHLGEHLSLPPFLEPRRRAIEAGLEPIG